MVKKLESLYQLARIKWRSFACAKQVQGSKHVDLGMQLIILMFVALVLVACMPEAQETAQEDVQDSSLPNFIVVLTDDQYYDTLQFMPELQQVMMEQGITFDSAYVTTPICCPSRSSILVGEYVHNHQVFTIDLERKGGFPRFRDLGHETETIAYDLDQIGYRTMLAGKYQNLYPHDTMTYVPPGWDEWLGWWRYWSWEEFAPEDLRPTNTERDRSYYNYYLNHNGEVTLAGERDEDYLTDVLTDASIEFLQTTPEDQPFFLYLNPFAPHGPFVQAERHRGAYDGIQLPDVPTIDSDEELRQTYQDYVETLLAVDEMVLRIVNSLEESNRLDNTYIIFLSDNGLLVGQHDIDFLKDEIYEEAIRVPMVVRGPGIEANQVVSEPVLNIDIAPTLAELAGLDTAKYDGRSIVSLLRGDTSSKGSWRQNFGIEVYKDDEAQIGIRTPQYVYVEVYAQTETDLVDFNDTPIRRILYDMVSDPYQTENIIDDVPAETITALSDALHRIYQCEAETCRELENQVINIE